MSECLILNRQLFYLPPNTQSTRQTNKQKPTDRQTNRQRKTNKQTSKHSFTYRLIPTIFISCPQPLSSSSSSSSSSLSSVRIEWLMLCYHFNFCPFLLFLLLFLFKILHYRNFFLFLYLSSFLGLTLCLSFSVPPLSLSQLFSPHGQNRGPCLSWVRHSALSRSPIYTYCFRLDNSVRSRWFRFRYSGWFDVSIACLLFCRVVASVFSLVQTYVSVSST